MTSVWPKRIDDVIPRLIARNPALAEVAADTADMYGAWAPTGFMGELRRWSLRHVGEPELLAAVLEDLDDAFIAGDAETQNVIAVGFVEDFQYSDPPPDPEGVVVSLFGPALTEEVEAFRAALPWVHHTEAGWHAVETASPGHRSSGAKIEEAGWWEALADWAAEACVSDAGSVQALLDDLDAEVGREVSRGRPYIMDWFLPRLLAARSSETLRGMLGAHLRQS